MAIIAEVAVLVLQATPGCPGCIEMSSPNLMSGLMAGLVLMMAAPFLVIFGIGGGLFRARRRALAEADEREGRGG